VLRALVQARLELEWSPEQIAAAWLRATFPGAPGLACLSRDDLPDALPWRQGRAEQAAHPATASRYLMLLHLPVNRTAEALRDGLREC